MTIFRRTKLPSLPRAAEPMPPRPPEGRQPSPEPGWASAWASNGAVNQVYDPTGAGPMARAAGKSGGKS